MFEPPLTPGHIVVCTDFSVASELPLAAASLLKKQFGGRVTIVHVYDSDAFTPSASRRLTSTEAEDIRTKLHAEIGGLLDETRRRHFDAMANVEVEVLEAGNAAAAICDFAGKVGADLVVIGTHGRTGLTHFFIGSVAERVVRHAPCPVLVLRSKAKADD